MMNPRSDPAILSICRPNFHPYPVTWYRFLSRTPETFVLLTVTKPCANYAP
jgi:hypothetical protein